MDLPPSLGAHHLAEQKSVRSRLSFGSMGVESETTGTDSRNSIKPAPAALHLGRIRLSAVFGGGFFLVFSWLVRLVASPGAREAADEDPGRTDDGKVVRDVKLEPTARKV